MAAFHRRNPGRLCALQSGPWPSPRSWEYAIRCLAAAQSVEADKGIELTLLAGLVGEAVAAEFCAWREALDLPDPEDLIAEAVAAVAANRTMNYQHPDRPDKVMAMLAGVNQAVITNNTAQRWQAGMAVMEQAARYDMDVALAGVKPLARACNGHLPSAEFVKTWLPRLQVALGD